MRAEPDAALFGVPSDYTRREANVVSAQSTAVFEPSNTALQRDRQMPVCKRDAS